MSKILRLILIIVAVLIVIYIGISLIVPKSLEIARERALNDSIKSTTQYLQAQAELYTLLDNDDFSYGNHTPEGECEVAAQTPDSLFSGIDMESSISSLKTLMQDKYQDGVCASEPDSFAVALPLVTDETSSSADFYCVDSSGARGFISGVAQVDIIVGDGTADRPFSCNPKTTTLDQL